MMPESLIDRIRNGNAGRFRGAVRDLDRYHNKNDRDRSRSTELGDCHQLAPLEPFKDTEGYLDVHKY